jgi:tetratricopeptide (TPR) repeat protein
MKRAERHYQTGMSKIQSGDQTNALVELSRAIQLNPKYEKAYLARGTARQALLDFGAAINDYGKVIELNPSNEPAFYNRGLCKLRLKDDRSALADLTEAVKLEPDDVKASTFVAWRG